MGQAAGQLIVDSLRFGSTHPFVYLLCFCLHLDYCNIGLVYTIVTDLLFHEDSAVQYSALVYGANIEISAIYLE